MIEVVRLDVRIRKLEAALREAIAGLDYGGYWSEARRAELALKESSDVQ